MVVWFSARCFFFFLLVRSFLGGCAIDVSFFCTSFSFFLFDRGTCAYVGCIGMFVSSFCILFLPLFSALLFVEWSGTCHAASRSLISKKFDFYVLFFFLSFFPSVGLERCVNVDDCVETECVP